MLFADVVVGRRRLGLHRFRRLPSARLPGRHLLLQPLRIHLPADLQLQIRSVPSRSPILVAPLIRPAISVHPHLACSYTYVTQPVSIYYYKRENPFRKPSDYRVRARGRRLRLRGIIRYRVEVEYRSVRRKPIISSNFTRFTCGRAVLAVTANTFIRRINDLAKFNSTKDVCVYGRFTINL